MGKIPSGSQFINKFFATMFVALLFFSCAKEGAINIPGAQTNRDSVVINGSVTVTSVEVVNDRIIVRGNNLNATKTLQIKTAGLDKILTIQSKTSSELIAAVTSLPILSILPNQIFSLVISTANAQSVIPIQFVINNGTITGSKLATGTITGDKIAEKTIPLSKISASGATTGQVATWDGVSWVPSTVSGGGSGGGDISSVVAGAGLLGGGTLGDVTLSVDSGNTANKIVKLDSVGWFMMPGIFQFSSSGGVGFDNGTNEWRLHNSSGVFGIAQLDVIDGVINIPFEIDPNGDVTMSEDVVVGKTLTVGAYTLPAADGANGEILVTNGAGVLAWTAVGGSGTVTNVTGSGSISVASGTTTPVVSINNTVSAGTYPKVTINGVGLVTSGSSLSAGDIPTGIPATRISAGSVDNTEFDFLNGVTAGIQTQFTGKEPSITAGTSAQYWRGDKTFQTLDTLAVTENTNLYFTDTRARTAAVADAINNGTLNIAPSQNAVFDALALKADATSLSNYIAKAGDSMTGDLGINNENEIRFYENSGSGTNYVALKAPATLGADYTFNLPNGSGTAGQVLSTDGAGVLSWVTQTSGADNLGNHTATQTLNLNGQWINGDATATEGMFINTDGNIGIGTATTTNARLNIVAPSSTPILFGRASGSSPTNLIQIQDVNPSDRLTLTATGVFSTGAIVSTNVMGGGSLTSRNDAVLAGNEIGQMNFKSAQNSEATYAEISTVAETIGAGIQNGEMLFKTMQGGTLGEKMRLSNDGLLGIGTTTPVAELHVHSPSDGVSYAQFTSSTTGSAWNDGMTIGYNSGGVIQVREAASLSFGTSDQSRMLLDANGRLGIGTVNPAAYLDIVAPTTSQIRLRDTTADTTTKTSAITTGHFTNAEENQTMMFMNSTATGALLELGGGLGALNGATEIGFYTAANNTTLNGTRRMWIDNTGKIKVGGATAPDNTLHVEGTFKLVDGTQAAGRVLTSDGSGAASWQAPGTGADNLGNHTAAQTLNMNGQWINGDATATEGIFVNTAGNVGIGTGSPGASLHVNGNIKAKAGFTVFEGDGLNGTNATPIIIDLPNGSSTRVGYTSTGDGNYAGAIGFYNSTQTLRSFIGAGAGGKYDELVFGNSVERMRIDTAGNLGVGVSLPQSKLDLQNGDLRLSDSAVVTTAKFNTQGVGTSGNHSILINGDSADRPEISLYRGNNQYPQFAMRMTASNDQGGSIWAGAGVAVPLEVMTFREDGKVGIGDTTPAAKLSIDLGNTASSANSHLELDANRTVGGLLERLNIYYDQTDNAYALSAERYLKVMASGLPVVRFQNDPDQYSIFSGGMRMTPRSAANVTQVVSGTTAQTASLTEWRDVGGTALTKVTAAGSLHVPEICDEAGANCKDVSTGWAGGGNDNLGNHTATQTLNMNGQWINGDSTAAEGMYVNTAGNVGIGTGGPSTMLHLYQPGTSNTGLTISQDAHSMGLSISSHTGILSHSTNLRLQVGSSIVMETNGAASAIGNHSPSLPRGVLVTPLSNGYKGMVLRSLAAQTANLYEWQNSAGTPYGLIDENGNMGINVANPLVKLHIDETAANTEGLIIDTAGGGSSLTLRDRAATHRSITMGHQGNALTINGGNAGASGFVISGASSDLILNSDNLDIFMRTSGVDRLKIENTGEIGIGTLTPTYELSIHDNSAAISGLNITNNVTGSGGGDGFSLQSNGGSVELVLRETGSLSLWTNSLQRMTIDSDGDVGIGVTSPGNKLAIDQGNVTNAQSIYISNMGPGTSGIAMTHNDGGIFELGGRLSDTFQFSATNRSLNYTVYGGAYDASPVAHNFTMDTYALGRHVMSVTGPAGHTGALQVWRDSGLTTLAQITAGGSLQIGEICDISGANCKDVSTGWGAGSIPSVIDDDPGSYNFFIGSYAGVNNIQYSGTLNTAFGGSSMENNTVGDHNTAMGYASLYLNVDGTYNTAIGSNSLYSNVSGAQNTAVGYYSLFNNTGNNNTAVGTNTLTSNTTGSDNVALGNHAMHLNSTGNYNIGIGATSLYSNDTGTANIGIGYYSLYYNVSGVGNIAIGSDSLSQNIDGIDNVAIGRNTMPFNNSGGYHIAIGVNASYSFDDISALPNVALGANALYGNATGGHNIAIGDSAGYGIVSGNNNIAVGASSAFQTTSGTDNLAIGSFAHYTNATGVGNIALGSSAGYNNVTGNDNILIGTNAAYNFEGGTANGPNIAIGSHTLFNSSSGGENVAIGSYAGYSNSTGEYNVVMGNGTFYNNTSGGYNTAIGYLSGLYVDGGNYNTLLGAQALGGGLAGSNNTVLGYQAGYNNAGNSNVFIGHQAGFNAAGDNLLYIANDSTATPLIYGEFDNAVVTINGDLNVAGELDIDFEIISSGLITMNTAWGGSGNYNGATAYWGGALATCPSGKYAIGGSCSTTHVIRTNISNAYISGVDSFQCYANSENNVEQLIAFVHCARLK